MKNKEPIFVVGFPKSGNTWLARLLAEVTSSKIKAENTVDAADNSSERKGDYIIIKMHDTDGNLQQGDVPVVYIIRDIRDVLVSAFFFNNTFIREDWVRLNNKCGWVRGLLCKAYFRHQIRRMNKRWCGNELSVLRNWIHGSKNTVGSWSDHLVSWAKNPSVVMVRYEDILQDTSGEMSRILEALKINVTDKVLKKTISNQSFENKKVKFQQSGNSKNVRFLRSGKAEGWREFLSPVIVKEIEMRHAYVMSEFGYELQYYEGKE